VKIKWLYPYNKTMMLRVLCHMRRCSRSLASKFHHSLNLYCLKFAWRKL